MLPCSVLAHARRRALPSSSPEGLCSSVSHGTRSVCSLFLPLSHATLLSLHRICHCLPCACTSIHPYSSVSSYLLLVCKFIPLFHYFSFLSVFQALLHLQKPPALSTSNQSYLQTSLFVSCLLHVMHFSILCLLSLPLQVELCPLVPGISLALLELVVLVMF